MIRDFILKTLGIDEKIVEAHDIKNQTTVTLGNLEMERRRIDRAIKQIKDAVDRQETIINDTATRIYMATGGAKRSR